MSENDQNLKRDAGKPRMDLLPWQEFTPFEGRVPVGTMYDALQKWWVGAPFSMANLDCVPRVELAGVATVLAFGATKYPPRGWEAGIPYSRVFAAACRHAEALHRGERIDSESGLAHESHFWCNVLFLVVFARRNRTDLDDRPAPVPAIVDALARAAEPASTRHPMDSMLSSGWSRLTGAKEKAS